MFKSLLYIAILTATVSASWIGLTVYHNSATSTISSEKKIIITPIPGEFDRETIEKVKSRKIIRADLSEKIDESKPIEATGSAASVPVNEELEATDSAAQL